MSDTLLGNQARADYGGDNERLRSAVCCFLPPLYPFKTRRNFLEVTVMFQQAQKVWMPSYFSLKLRRPGSARNLALSLAGDLFFWGNF